MPKKVGFDLPNEKPELAITIVPDHTQIQDLCAEIQKAGCSELSPGCLGILDSGSTRYGLWPPASPSCCYTRETNSLEELFVHENLDKRDRLRLGVQLASSVMQLHGTGWLNESWGKRDIYFFCEERRASGTQYTVPIVNKPFLRRTFDPTSRSSSLQLVMPTAVKSPLVQYDRSLFSLGIVLVELWFGKRLEDLLEYRKTAKTHGTSDKDCVEYHTANQLIPRIQSEEGELYGDAVRRCIRGLDCTATSLEEAELKNKAHAEVVFQLERHWKAYDDREK
jgi:hypothetical protein